MDLLDRAVALGARPGAAHRAGLALERLASSGGPLTILAAPGVMGAGLAIRHGFWPVTVGRDHDGDTSGADTRRAAAEMAALGVDILLFAGGDGTARDVHAAVGTSVPVVGVPTGVKMHSGVFAATPAAAGDTVIAHLRRDPSTERLMRAELVDREIGEGPDPGGVRLYGEMLVPLEPARVLAAKARSGGSDRGDLRRLQAAVVDAMEPGRLYILGPGGTVGGVRRILGLPERPLAVAAVRDRRLVGDDLSEDALLAVLDEAPSATLVVGVIGGQGSLLGRGNQQLSPRVLWRVGLDNLVVLCSFEKLVALSPPQLHVDTGDDALDRALTGYRPVRVAPRRTVLFQVTT
jgi:predicted polyphosphate/ATP-dependent NAD kinase